MRIWRCVHSCSTRFEVHCDRSSALGTLRCAALRCVALRAERSGVVWCSVVRWLQIRVGVPLHHCITASLPSPASHLLSVPLLISRSSLSIPRVFVSFRVAFPPFRPRRFPPWTHSLDCLHRPTLLTPPDPPPPIYTHGHNSPFPVQFTHSIVLFVDPTM